MVRDKLARKHMGANGLHKLIDCLASYVSYYEFNSTPFNFLKPLNKPIISNDNNQ
jgi:hypothetical protein